MYNNKFFQSIYNRIVEYIPNNWELIVFYAEYIQYSYTMEFYYKMHNKWVKCFDIAGCTEDDFISLFENLNLLISEEREHLNDANQWISMTLVIDSHGKVKADYSYDEKAVDSYSSHIDWKTKYLV